MQINVLEYLEQAAYKYPDKVALKDETREITFSGLELEAKALGTRITEKISGSVRNPVIVLVDRTCSTVIAFMGVLYSGNYYVPIDNQTPPQRLGTIISTLRPSLILSQAKDVKAFAGMEALPEILELDEIQGRAEDEKLRVVRSRLIDTDPVYTIFTSGSTGTPKGIVVSHKSVMDLAEWLSDTFGFTSGDVIGNQTPFYFDASVKDIYLCLKEGITLCIIPKKLFMFPVKLVEYLNVNRITAILWATSAITLLSNSQIFKKVLPEHLNKVFFAGEAMFAKNLNGWRKYLPDVRYVNLYGPTEATVDCTYYIVNREFGDEEVIPIGNACRNMEVILLDEDRRPVEGSGPGELCVRGTGVALGYINSPELSSEVFIQNPLNTAYRDILYCTGDIVRYNEHGELLFLSRKDGQVKHMGSRIELGEIEAAVNGVEQVQSCVCFYDHQASKIILFYTGSIDKTQLAIKLGQRLPRYMLPNVIEQYEAFPYNANGKIDRRKLSEKYANEKN